MKRIVQPEMLDELPADDPRAEHSRRDLRRINALMGNAGYIGRFLVQHAKRFGNSPMRLAEIGAGEGLTAAKICEMLARENVHGNATLVDKRPVVGDESKRRISQAGWDAEVVAGDVFAWLESRPKLDVISANLFLHHFEGEALRRLIAGVAEACGLFVAVDPRRNRFAEFVSGQVGLIGCNKVTRNDALISVRAGFRDGELTQVWGAQSGWKLEEHSAGLFSHFFAAVRME